MNGHDLIRPGPAEGCGRLITTLLDGYIRNDLAPAAAWSVEAHVPGCPACRAAVTARVDADRLARTRSVMLTRLALPEGGPLRRALRWCGVSDELITLLAATPSLRRSWLAGVTAVLVVGVGGAQLAAAALPFAGPPVLGGPSGPWWHLIPFLALAPLLPVGAVAIAFSARLDPGHELAVAAPVSGLRLLCTRAVAVIAATLVPTALAALALPGPPWLPVILLLPALAVCAAALAAATVAGPVGGAAGAGAAWLAVVVAAGLAGHNPALAFGPAGQLAAAAVLVTAVALVAFRRDRLELDWTRGGQR
jgi:hypothetical protein